MRVLVTVASKHGATEEIGRRIAMGLEAAGLAVVSVAPEAVISIDGYDAVVLGSGVYAGRWLGPAKDLVHRVGPELKTKRVWLFSSGPIGESTKPDDVPPDAAAMIAATDAVEHRVFAGRLDVESLGFAEKLIIKTVRAPSGDFRPWAEIDAWASDIAGALVPEAAIA
ncbi:MAG TPA: flavodoxin domain-containing protein [Candidatus Limnocylindrales bacterium]|jgi:menaquinone-dependent protoporphyrinogen oxidase